MNKYEQISVAGEGAYGIVLKCKNKETGELVAIKKFREPDEVDEEARRFTQREVKILKALKHENIVSLKEAFRREGLLYLVFEYVPYSMMDLLEENGTGVGIERTRTLMFQLARALEHCHSHNIIHRDIKPENLLVNKADNSLHLCDFGSACKITTSNAVLTDYVATRWYRAPELLVSFNNYGKSVDMWGLGCVMAELTVGQPLFTGKSDIDQLSIIHRALGPLTREQRERCLELSDFQGITFPQGNESDTLKKRFAHVMPAPQLQLLEQILVMDPAQRLTAKAALSSTWLKDVQAPRTKDVQASRTKQSSRPNSQQSRASQKSWPPPLLKAEKPRVHRHVSPCPVQAQLQAPAKRNSPPRVSVEDKAQLKAVPSEMRPPVINPSSGVGLVAISADCNQPEIQESIASFSGAPFQAASQLRDSSPEPCEESIPEEFDTMPDDDVQETLNFNEEAEPEQVDSCISIPSRFVSSVLPDARARSSPPPMKGVVQPLNNHLKRRVRPSSGHGGIVHMRSNH